MAFGRLCDLQFVNVKAWLLALTMVAGWVVGFEDQLARLAIIVPVMLCFAFASNLFTHPSVHCCAVGWHAANACCGLTVPWPGAGAHRYLDDQRLILTFLLPMTTASTPPIVPTTQKAAVASAAALERKGMWLGLLGVAVFSLTLPMTRIAWGTPDAHAAVWRVCGYGARGGSRWLICTATVVAGRGVAYACAVVATGAHLAGRGVWLSPAHLNRHAFCIGHARRRYYGLVALGNCRCRCLAGSSALSHWFLGLYAVAGAAMVVGFAIYQSGGQGLHIHQ